MSWLFFCLMKQSFYILNRQQRKPSMDVSSTEDKKVLHSVPTEMPPEAEATDPALLEEKEIEEKVEALKQLVSVHELVMRGKHEGIMHKRISDADKFISSLHKKLMSEIENHSNKELAHSILTKHMAGQNGQ